MFDKYHDILTVKEVQELLHVGRSTAYKLVQSGDIQTVRVGTKYLVPKQSVLEYLKLQ